MKTANTLFSIIEEQNMERMKKSVAVIAQNKGLKEKVHLIVRALIFNWKNEGGETMKFPKQVMTTKELMGMGFSIRYLHGLIHIPGQKMVWRADPKVPNSKMLFDTEELSKYIDKCREAERVDGV